MKVNLLFLLLIEVLIMFSCATTKKTSQQITQMTTEEMLNDSTLTDTLSNYFLLDYANSLTSKEYELLLDSIKNETSIDFFSLRMAHTHTNHYSPYESQSQIILHETDKAIEQKEYKVALEKVNKILDDNFLSISAHLYKGYIHKTVGDTAISQYHYKIYEGLIKSIAESGDGKTPKTAFIVISTKEEYELLDYFYMYSTGQSLINEDGHSFDILKAVDRTDNKEYDISFNIDLPYTSMSKMFSD